ncbi:MAG: hypothetical protein DME17_21430 [Candidatus Rokuibacteriota bacterium]|nr:MAG: hypothetical protein DME17_21430 [Candidatus Rokubacteria bacterium]
MKCPRCQHETPSDAEFCPECGAKLALICSQCRTANAPGHKFCKKFGQPLPSGAARAPDASRIISPQSYTRFRMPGPTVTSSSPGTTPSTITPA